MSYAIACARATVFRAVVVYSGAQLSGCSGGTQPIGYFGIHGISDPVVNIGSGRSLRDTFVRNNGCTPQNAPEPVPGSARHITTTYSCRAGAGQRWTYTANRQLMVYGNKCLDANGRGTTNGTAVIMGLQRPGQPAVDPQRQRQHRRRAVRAVPGRQRRGHRQRHEDPAVVLQRRFQPEMEPAQLTGEPAALPARYRVGGATGVAAVRLAAGRCIDAVEWAWAFRSICGLVRFVGGSIELRAVVPAAAAHALVGDVCRRGTASIRPRCGGAEY